MYDHAAAIEAAVKAVVAPEVMTAEDVGQLLRISTRSARERMRRGELGQTFMSGRRRYILKTVLMERLRARSSPRLVPEVDP